MSINIISGFSICVPFCRPAQSKCENYRRTRMRMSKRARWLNDIVFFLAVPHRTSSVCICWFTAFCNSFESSLIRDFINVIVAFIMCYILCKTIFVYIRTITLWSYLITQLLFRIGKFQKKNQSSNLLLLNMMSSSNQTLPFCVRFLSFCLIKPKPKYEIQICKNVVLETTLNIDS